MDDNREFEQGPGKKSKNSKSQPKKPVTALKLFSQEVGPTIKLENPDLGEGEVYKMAAERWAKMKSIEKYPYTTEAKNGKKRFEKEKLKNFGPSYATFDAEGSDSEGNKHKRGPYSPGDDWNTDRPKGSAPKSENKVSINMSSVEAGHSSSRIPQKQIEEPVSVNEPKFYFNPGDVKQAPEMSRNTGNPALIKQGSNGFPVNNMRNPDTVSGSTNTENLMSRPNMFSPTPFAPNRSPGVSPNMIARFNPFTHNPMDNNIDYSNRANNTPSVMGQSINMSINRSENYSNRPNLQKNGVGFTPQNMMASPAINPFGSYGMPNASPSGFTPIRTNFARQSPMFWNKTKFMDTPRDNKMFSPNNNEYFNTSPNINCLSNSSFGYQRTPVSNYNKPVMQMGGKQGIPPQNDQQQVAKKGGNEEDIFALNPFGS